MRGNFFIGDAGSLGLNKVRPLVSFVAFVKFRVAIQDSRFDPISSILIFGICRVINKFDYDPISLQILQKNLVCIRFVCLVEAYFPGPTRLIIVAYNNVKSMFLAVVGRKSTELQRRFCVNCALLCFKI